MANFGKFSLSRNIKKKFEYYQFSKTALFSDQNKYTDASNNLFEP